MAIPPRQETLTFPPSQAALLAPYLPPLSPSSSSSSTPPRPHVTLTYATSLDAALALGPGIRTALSGPASKAMTHYLRTRHDAILVGVGTAVADDPALNARIAGAAGIETQPRPVVLDPRGRWDVRDGARVVAAARAGLGKAVWVVVGAGVEVAAGRRAVVEGCGGRVVRVGVRGDGGRFAWGDVLAVLWEEGVRSLMVEGGGEVINSLLAPSGNGFVDSVIVTVAPTWLGQGGVVVSPPRTVGEDGAPAPPVRLADVQWCPLGEDVVLCGRIQR
ncbi:dihydrofolate reductase [Trichocladium antarcticum]|uniref:2,5-diamino-6-ribosylamino-4(3H)-pyrimidinone 5'-phosphate reductase n=1 Tax=Trichocladium antarcticum TaxID=1450529 RepID=A0AAN6UKG8_9PEZI|nr:dihydrofolate reductase [Trichocladium antarcticum]